MMLWGYSPVQGDGVVENCVVFPSPWHRELAARPLMPVLTMTSESNGEYEEVLLDSKAGGNASHCKRDGRLDGLVFQEPRL